MKARLLTTIVLLWTPTLIHGQDLRSPPNERPRPAASQPAASMREPVVPWPVKEAYRRLYPDRVSVLQPVFPDLPETDWDALISYSGGKLEALHARTGRTIWPQPVGCHAQPILLGTDADRYVFATPHRIFALARTTGRLAWGFGQQPPDDAGADPESILEWTKHFMTDRCLYATSDRGDLVCLDPRDGGLRWRVEGAVEASSLLAADDRFVCCATMCPNSQNTATRGTVPIIAVRHADTGRLAREVQLSNDLPVHALSPVCGGMLMAILSNVIVLIDPATGRTSSRIETTGRFVVATSQATANALFVSTDGRRITKYHLPDGRVMWKTPRIGADGRAGIWSHASGGLLYAASADALMAFDAADGHPVWRVTEPPGLGLQSPQLTRDAIVTISPETHGPTRDRGVATAPADVDAIPATRYRVRRFDRATGRERPITSGTILLTEPLESFGGLFLRNHCLAVLDGSRLIGYVRSN
ncbi:MAG: PQQ-binding-like beta-propeller repeat protein [Phycisphaerae bacterium]|nr:PQQ-binding-like beta-propeller repeat protein [Phycisphaerae bacterium]